MGPRGKLYFSIELKGLQTQRNSSRHYSKNLGTDRVIFGAMDYLLRIYEGKIAYKYIFEMIKIIKFHLSMKSTIGYINTRH